MRIKCHVKPTFYNISTRVWKLNTISVSIIGTRFRNSARLLRNRAESLLFLRALSVLTAQKYVHPRRTRLAVPRHFAQKPPAVPPAEAVTICQKIQRPDSADMSIL